MNSSQLFLRSLTRAAALAVVVAVPSVALPASANVPDGWSDPAPVDALQALVIFVGIPLVLFVGITLLVMAPSLASSQRSSNALAESEWFGGPRKSVDELEAGPSEDTGTGGASGRW